ncbi:hypothetical protein OH77DRAFT_1084615 [Trametes cingulata]|nr:hypothetical protein OH77DRAFT_1084615 [Trametes cingulata]
MRACGAGENCALGISGMRHRIRHLQSYMRSHAICSGTRRKFLLDEGERCTIVTFDRLGGNSGQYNWLTVCSVCAWAGSIIPVVGDSEPDV